MKYELIFPNTNLVRAQTFVSSPAPVSAATAAPQRNTGVGVPINVNGTPTSSFYYKTYIQAVYNYSITLGSSLAVLMIIYAGYKYLTSRGDSTALSEAKDIFAGALLGLAVLLLIRLILNFIGLPTESIPGTPAIGG